MPIPTTTEDTVSDMAMVSTVATGLTVLDTATTMARGRLRLMPIPTTTEDTDMVATELTVSDTDTVSDTAAVSTATARGRLGPTTESTLPTTPLPLVLRWIRIRRIRSRIQRIRRIRSRIRP